MIEVIEHGAVRQLRLARPPANALSPQLVTALSAALDEAAANQVRGLVLSGAPGMFSAGLDLPLLVGLDRAAMRDLWSGFYALLHRLAASPVPVVAAITGHSPAGGAVLTLYCDLRVMAEGDFRIGLKEVRVGLPMPPVILAAARRLVGPRLAERLCVSGELVSPARAAQMGLVDELAAPDQVIGRAVAMAAELAGLPPLAMADTRRQARADLVEIFAGAAEEMEGLLDSWFRAEAQETMRALVARLAQKRAAS